MMLAAGSMKTSVAIIATFARGRVSISETDERGDMRYVSEMMDLWVKDALAHSGLKQAELARRLTEKLKVSIDRAAVNKMTTGARRVSGVEMLAIEEITGWPAPTSRESNISMVPQISWVSAGALSSQEPVDVRQAVDLIAVPELPQGQWIALEVQGDSMDRVSPAGSVIFVNCADTNLVNGRFYVISDEKDHGTTYKRYRSNPDRFVPFSTNPDHEPIYPENGFRVIGRVWRTHKDL